jgi:anti-sigma factor RsiW
MNPCSKNHKKIAWLALDALDPAEEQDLRAHLEGCPACRAYWEEISTLSGKLSSARPSARLEASERFHQQVVRAVRNESRSSTDRLFTLWHSLAWRVALPVMVIGAVVIAVLSPGLWHRQTSQESPAALPSRTAIRVDLEPTVSNYQMVANDSLDQLDDLLTSQGNHNLPPIPRFPGPALAGANALE